MDRHDKSLKVISFRLPPQYRDKLSMVSRQVGITQTLALELLIGYTSQFELKKLVDKWKISQK